MRAAIVLITVASAGRWTIAPSDTDEVCSVIRHWHTVPGGLKISRVMVLVCDTPLTV